MNANEFAAPAGMVVGLPHHCNGCTNRWNGYHTCHCAACHVTFSNIDCFDRHRRAGRCQPPVTAGLIESGRRYECWGRPDDRRHPFSLAVSAPEGSKSVGVAEDTGDVVDGAQISRAA